MNQRDEWIYLLSEHNPQILDDTSGLPILTLQASLKAIREREELERTRSHFEKLRRLQEMALQKSEHIQELQIQWKVEGESICIEGDTSHNAYDEIRELVDETLHAMSPWRKGPFSILGTFVNAEWRSMKKWERLKEIYDIEQLCRDKHVIDIGVNNGYYSFLMLSQGARLVLGIDPLPRYVFFMEFYKLLMPTLPLYYEQWGVADCESIPESFDTAFCMGILYHQRNPLLMLEQVHRCLKRDGILVLETICLNDHSPYCLVPSDRYMRSRGYWFIPSVEVLKTWVYKAGFEILACGEPYKTDLEEQRQTEWIRGESLESFLDKDNLDVTVEGYPAPYRVALIARKRF